MMCAGSESRVERQRGAETGRSIPAGPQLVSAGDLRAAHRRGNFDAALGALLLATVNIVCVNLAGVVTFFAQNIRPWTWWEADRARRATRIAIALSTLALPLLAGLIVVLSTGVRP
jgi:hypothetical protein